MTYKQRILSEIEGKYDEWKLGNSAETKYRCEAYKELIELIKPMQEESVSDNLEKAAKEWRGSLYSKDAFIAGAKWQFEQFEKNRLAACDRQTKEEAEIERDFVTNIIEKEHRQPTYNDAIKYSMELKEQQIMNKAIDATIGYFNHGGLSIDVKLPKDLKENSKCKLIIIKEK